MHGFVWLGLIIWIMVVIVGQLYAVALAIAAFMKLFGARANAKLAFRYAIFPTLFGVVPTWWLLSTPSSDLRCLLPLAALPTILGVAAMIGAFFKRRSSSKEKDEQDG